MCAPARVRVTEQLVRLQTGEWLRKEPKTAVLDPLDHDLGGHRRTAGRPSRGLCQPWYRRAGLPQQGGEPADLLELVEQQHRPGAAQDRLVRRFQISDTPASPWLSPREPIPRRSRPAWGHSSIRVTLDRYGHLFPELDEGLAASFGARLVEAREKRIKSTVVHAAFRTGLDRLTRWWPVEPPCRRSRCRLLLTGASRDIADLNEREAHNPVDLAAPAGHHNDQGDRTDEMIGVVPDAET